MKKVLCFGDSNVYGFIPKNGKRYDENTRWSGILKKLSASKFEIIEAGCNNRTAFCENPAGVEQSGCEALPLLMSQKPGCVILSIGINDLQFFYNISLVDMKKGVQKLIDIAASSGAKIVLAAPSAITQNILSSGFAAMFDETSVEKSEQLPVIYKSLAEKNGCLFINLDEIAAVSAFDGLHYEPDEHKKIAHAIFELLSKNLL